MSRVPLWIWRDTINYLKLLLQFLPDIRCCSKVILKVYNLFESLPRFIICCEFITIILGPSSTKLRNLLPWKTTVHSYYFYWSFLKLFSMLPLVMIHRHTGEFHVDYSQWIWTIFMMIWTRCRSAWPPSCSARPRNCLNLTLK